MTTKEERLEIFERDDFRCRYCLKARAVHVDHIFPVRLFRNGQLGRADINREAMENKASSCFACNTIKSHSTWVPRDWADRIPELKEQLPGHVWKIFCGESAGEMARKVAA